MAGTGNDTCGAIGVGAGAIGVGVRAIGVCADVVDEFLAALYCSESRALRTFRLVVAFLM